MWMMREDKNERKGRHKTKLASVNLCINAAVSFKKFGAINR